MEINEFWEVPTSAIEARDVIWSRDGARSFSARVNRVAELATLTEGRDYVACAATSPGFGCAIAHISAAGETQ